MNWQVAITNCNSYRLRTNNGDNYPYILQCTKSTHYDMVEITFVRKFFVHKVRNRGIF